MCVTVIVFVKRLLPRVRTSSNSKSALALAPIVSLWLVVARSLRAREAVLHGLQIMKQQQSTAPADNTSLASCKVTDTRNCARDARTAKVWHRVSDGCVWSSFSMLLPRCKVNRNGPQMKPALHMNTHEKEARVMPQQQGLLKKQ